jgi:hypothetical protein
MRNIKLAALVTGIIPLLFSCVLISSLSKNSEKNVPYIPPSMQEQEQSGYWITRPSGNSITVIGVSNRMVKRESEIDAAKTDAARKIAMFHGVQGRIESYSRTGSAGYFDAINISNVELLYDKNYENYIEQLKYDPQKDVLITDNALYIYFKFNASMEHLNYSSVKDNNGRPVWVNSPLHKIGGYMAAVGFAQKQRWIKDTFAKSTDDAAARLIQTISTQFSNLEKTRVGGSASGDIYTKSEAKLNKFLVLEQWIEPVTGNVYTLALARESK